MTELLYLQDTYLYESKASILEIWNNDFWEYILLDKTIFYPQWWGQPSDIGTIKKGENIFQVTKCMLDQNWIVYHYWKSTSSILKVGGIVSLNINKDTRILNARNHSAWHLLDVAMQKLWHNKLSPTKWYHFNNGPYVEYKWEFNEDKEVFLKKLEVWIEKLVHSSLPVCIKYEWLSSTEAPTGKIPRYVSFKWYTWCGCGGTHIKNTSEIWPVSIRKIRYKKWVLRVSYNLD